MNPNKQSVTAGILLIALGFIWWLNLWWLIWPGALVAAGVIAYRQRRIVGRPVEAVQAALWCIGLALLFLLDFIWPGVLFLAGASVLIRGRETQIDEGIRRALVQAAKTRRAAPRSIPRQQVPITTSQVPVAPTTPHVGIPEPASSGETKRLHE